jgi:hypothetical protein
MSQEIRFGPDVGGTARAMMRKTKDVTLTGRSNEPIDVVETAIEHPAIKRKRECVMFGDELRYGVRPRRRVEGLKIDQGRCLQASV